MASSVMNRQSVAMVVPCRQRHVSINNSYPNVRFLEGEGAGCNAPGETCYCPACRRQQLRYALVQGKVANMIGLCQLGTRCVLAAPSYHYRLHIYEDH
ncbi:hypothetical protein JB92DRAFT_2946131 [Gautieria morchelliformis]|nr:hypothetical protein JB92DRAFT_2946131 [Gautieria morchelliformis]